jgi:archaeal flagellar protein FlaF
VILMGLETVIIAFFVIGTIVVVACTLTAGANNIIKSSYEGYSAFSQTTMDRLHTNIKLINATLNTTDKHVHLTVENTGETKLSNFDLWDVIVVNNSQASYFKKNEGFSYTFTRDFINPGILDPDESIDMELLHQFNSGDSLYLTVITENGITSSAIYTVS